MATHNISHGLSEIDTQTPLFPISTVATTLNVHQRTLRIYDEAGILVPSRSQKNRRCYSQDDLHKGMLIQYLTRELGFNLAGVKIILQMLKVQGHEGVEAIHYLKEIAGEIDITPEMQAENKIKFLKRGKRPSA